MFGAGKYFFVGVENEEGKGENIQRGEIFF